MADLPDFKRGDTFLLTLTFTDPSGNAEDLTLVTLRSQLRGTLHALVQEMSVNIADQTTSKGVATISADAVTTAFWSPGEYLLDVKRTDANGVQHTEDMTLTVIEAQTA